MNGRDSKVFKQDLPVDAEGLVVAIGSTRPVRTATSFMETARWSGSPTHLEQATSTQCRLPATRAPVSSKLTAGASTSRCRMISVKH